MDCDFKMPERNKISHKGTFGKVLNIAGSDYMPGAAYLSSMAALTCGCGYVYLCSNERVITAVAAQSQNIVFVPLVRLKEQLSSADVLLLGCGLSQEKQAHEIFRNTFDARLEIPVVIDADGLNLLSSEKPKILPNNLILTPHPGEAANLLGVSIENILSEPIHYAIEISKKYNCVTVLKSHNTIVCAKDFEIYENNKPNSALAKAGSGDVLAGLIAGLLAQGCETFYAAKLGVYLHSKAGELAKNDLTEYGVLAVNQIRYIPYAIKTLL